MEDIHRASRGTYGSPRIFAMIKGQGLKCSKSKVERKMREMGIRAKTKRKYKATTDSNHKLPVSENLLNRNFTPIAPNIAWGADITYVWTEEGWLYLAVVLDLFSRKIVGWSIQDHMRSELVTDALLMAQKRQKPLKGLILHSDRGSQYASGDYRKLIQNFGMLQSMSRKGDCWDNAPVESFFHTLKTEHVFLEKLKTKSEAKSSIFEWIEVFYNRQRIHSSLKYKAPECYESEFYLKNVA
ncbi:MAG: IS3 family transposase [Oligoflexia bacterium]|nr:IS3 family transposase [Oligoflexia bacterium]